MRHLCAVITTTLLAGTAIADTINVPGDYALIQDAIDASVNGDVINIAAGTYNEHSLNPNGKAITIQGTLDGDGTLATTIDGQQGGSVFEIQAGVGTGRTIIKNLMITGGSSYEGGGFYLQSDTTITGCTITGNTSELWGGGVHCGSGQIIVSGCQITNNTGKAGAGINIETLDGVQVLNCTIDGNIADDDGSGAGIRLAYGGVSASVEDCTISNNLATYKSGGIGLADFANITVTNCIITGNTAGDYAGGIGLNESAQATISDCIIRDNVAGQLAGGVGLNILATAVLSNCEICGNTPDQVYANVGSQLIIEGDHCEEDSCEDCSGLPIPTGACCLDTGCFVTTNLECTKVGGTWIGEDTDCNGCNDPPATTGPCCVTSGCFTGTSEQCTAAGGTWLGPEGTCDACTQACPGDATGDGQVNVEDLLTVIANWNSCP